MSHPITEHILRDAVKQPELDYLISRLQQAVTSDLGAHDFTLLRGTDFRHISFLVPGCQVYNVVITFTLDQLVLKGTCNVQSVIK